LDVFREPQAPHGDRFGESDVRTDLAQIVADERPEFAHFACVFAVAVGIAVAKGSATLFLFLKKLNSTPKEVP